MFIYLVNKYPENITVECFYLLSVFNNFHFAHSVRDSTKLQVHDRTSRAGYTNKSGEDTICSVKFPSDYRSLTFFLHWRKYQNELTSRVRSTSSSWFVGHIMQTTYQSQFAGYRQKVTSNWLSRGTRLVWSGAVMITFRNAGSSFRRRKRMNAGHARNWPSSWSRESEASTVRSFLPRNYIGR